MQFKSVKGNIIYAVLLFTVMMVVFYIEMRIRERVATEFNYLTKIIYIAISYPIVGAMIGLPNLWKQFNEEGLWKVNAPRMIFLGLPSFVIANFVFAATFLPNETIMLLASKNFMLLSMSDVITYVFQILFGFVLVTSFYKKKQVSVRTDTTQKESS